MSGRGAGRLRRQTHWARELVAGRALAGLIMRSGAMRMPVIVSAALIVLLAGGSAGLVFGQAQGRILDHLLTLGPAEQVPAVQAPARDARPVRRTGTAAIRGRVVDGGTGQPLVHARVRIGGVGANVGALTDASGTFVFSGLPSGRYSLVAMKPSYLQGSFPESTTSLRGNGGLVLTDGQTIENVTVSLYHGGVVTGRLVDAYGDPVENVNVQAVRLPGPRSSQGYSMSGSANDAGEFRVGRLEPGRYVLFAVPYPGHADGDPDVAASVPTYYPGVSSPDEAQPVVVGRGQTVSNLDFQVIEQPVTSVTGLVIDSTGQPAQGGNVNALSQYTTPLGGGTMSRGGAQVRPDGTFELKLPPGEYRLSAFARSRDDAARVQATQANGIRNFASASQETGTARVIVTGEPVTSVVINTGGGGTISGRIVIEGDGPPPDPRRINVHAGPQRLASQVSGPPDECRAIKPGIVNADLTFTIEDVRGICVLDLNLMGNGGGAGGMLVWGVGSRLRVKSAMYRDVDLLDRPVEIGPNQHVNGVQVTVTDRLTELSADITDDQGAPAADYVLLAFSTDKARWALPRYLTYQTRSSNQQPLARAVSAPSGAAANGAGAGVTAAGATGAAAGAGVAVNGATPPAWASATSTLSVPAALGVGTTTSASTTTLPAGDYYVIALDDATYEEIRDPAYLDQLIAHATRVTLREGEPQKVQLRRVASPSSSQ